MSSIVRTEKGKKKNLNYKYVKYKYLNYRSPSNDTKRGVHGTIWVFLHSNNFKIECAFKFRMSDMSFSETQSSRTNEPLVLWRFSGKTRPNKCSFCNHSLPLLGCKMLSHIQSDLLLKMINMHAV